MKGDLFNFDESLGNGFDTQPKNDYEEKLKKARILCIRGRFEQALAICEEILDEDMENMGAYIEILRVHTEDFTIYEGSEIDKDIHAIERLFPDIDNEEYIDYLQKRRKALSQKPKQVDNNINSVANTNNSTSTSSGSVNQSATCSTTSSKNATINGLKSLNELISILNNRNNYSTTQIKDAKSQLEVYANNGNSYALYYIGYGYAHRQNGYSANNQLALEYLRKSVALGSPEGILELAEIYLNGQNGEKKDISKGRELILEAVNLNYEVAICNVAYYHKEGKFGFKKDIYKAIEYYEKAVALGSGSAMYFLGKIYESKEYGMKDVSKAVEYYKKAASSNNQLCSKWAKEELARLGYN